MRFPCRRQRLNIAQRARTPRHSARAAEWGVMNPAFLPAPMHLGALHPYEQLLVTLIAFGPFVVLFVVVYVVRKRDVAAEEKVGPGQDLAVAGQPGRARPAPRT